MRQRGHRVIAAYDRLTCPLEHTVLGERRAGLLTGLEGQVLDVGAGSARISPLPPGQPGHLPPSLTLRCAGG